MKCLRIHNRVLKPALIVLFSGVTALFAQPAERKMSAQEYVDKYKEDAVREMLISGVPASITLAQGMLESGNGNSALAVYANNHFGIKCHKGWTGESYVQDDDEKNECFRKYPSVYDSYLDHSDFLRTRQRYAFLFELKVTDYKGWAKGLKQAGYATDPRYADRLIDLIEANNLNELDKVQGAAAKPIDTKEKPQPVAVVTPASGQRKMYENNGVKYIIVRKDDSFLKLSNELDLAYPELFRYNDLKRDARLETGQVLYIAPKKKKNDTDTHTVKPGETIHSIAQLYGVKLRALRKYNKLEPGEEPKAGQQIRLRKK
ncbi:MAG: hypothetical protein FD123_2693 [Bacteroidetes bacterium]|nr:MAG: hypothetical protein FD123_2693 [Bacteroidota bacterium]